MNGCIVQTGPAVYMVLQEGLAAHSQKELYHIAVPAQTHALDYSCTFATINRLLLLLQH